MSTDYTFWQRALSGDRDQNIDLNQPQCGFWRRWVRDTENPKVKRGVAVAIWKDGDGQLRCVETLHGKAKPGDHDRAVAVWPWCAEPISEDTYRAVAERGENWPDQDATVAEQIAPGHNNPPEDPAELLKEQIENAEKGVDAYATIESDEALKQAQSLRARLLELRGEADKTREAEKRPHLEASKAVDAKWMPLVKAAKAAADRVSGYITDALNAIARREAEERRLAEAERLRQEQEARERDATLNAPDAPPAAAPEPAPSAVPTQIKGAYGRAASVKIVQVVTEVTDYDALYQHFKGDDDVKALLKTKAQRAVTAGYQVPGVTVEDQRRVA